MARAPRRKKGGPVRVNFKGVETRNLPPEGDFVAKVLEAEVTQSGAGNDQIAMVSEISRGEYKGNKLYMYFPLAENSLWKLAAFLTAIGIEVPQDEMDVDPAEMVDKEFVAVVHHETYNGKKQAKMGDFDSLENYSGDLDEDEPKKGKKKDKKSKDDADDKSDKKDKGKKGKSKKESEPEPDEPKKGKKDKSKDKSRDKGKSKDEPEEKSKKDKGKKNKKPSVQYDSDEVQGMSAKKLQKLIDEHDLDVDLDDYKTDRKKAGAVIDALEEKGMIED